MIATIGFLLALEYTKYVFGRGSVPDHAGGAYTHTTLFTNHQRSPDSLAGLRGPYF